MGHDKPLWVGRGIKTATFQPLRFEDLHVLNQVVIWHSKAPKCWLQILSKWAVINHSDWGEASKLQHFKASILTSVNISYDSAFACQSQHTCNFQLPQHSRVESPRPQNADFRFPLNKPWEATLTGERHQNCNMSTSTAPFWRLACA